MLSWVEQERERREAEFHFIYSIFITTISSKTSDQTQPNHFHFTLSISNHYPSTTTPVKLSHHTNMSWGTHIYVVYNSNSSRGSCYMCSTKSTSAYMLLISCTRVEGLVLHSLYEPYHHSQQFSVKYLPYNYQKHSKTWNEQVMTSLPLTPYPLRLLTYSTTLGSSRLIQTCFPGHFLVVSSPFHHLLAHTW